MRRLSIRVRLTVLYGSLFFLAGAVLLGVTYLLVKQTITTTDKASVKIAAIKDTVSPLTKAGEVRPRRRSGR